MSACDDRKRAGKVLAVLLVSALAAATVAAEERQAGDCIRIESVTSFSPRDEIYVEVRGDCTPEDFAVGDPVIAYVEVLLSNLPPATEAVRVYRAKPQVRETVTFEGLPISKGDEILVRIVNSGEIVSLRTITAR